MDIDILHVTQDITHGITIIFVCAVLIVLASFIDMWSGIDAAHGTEVLHRMRPRLFGKLIRVPASLIRSRNTCTVRWQSLKYL